MDTLRAAAVKVAALHKEADKHVQRVIFYPDPEGKEMRLLELVENTPRVGVRPFGFAPTTRIPYRVVLVDIAPDEYPKVEDRTLPLPDGWDQNAAVEL